jgi:carotenoid 1,2-hydratase
MSDDGQHGITLIAFVGSVFSPYYAWARQRGRVNPDNHCALNVAIYSKGKGRWAMTERGHTHSARSAQAFIIGPSQLQWDGDCLTIDINEVCVPLPRRIRGRIKLWPQQLCAFSTRLDNFGRHRWGPLAPASRIEVALSSPDLKWQGHAYLDSNEGDEPIDQGFHTWDWSRARMRDGSTLVFYDMQAPNTPDRVLSLRFTPKGQVEPIDTPPVQRLPKTGWRIDRRMRSAQAVQVQEQLEDTPFYQRALLQFDHAGEPLLAFHETLSVPRLVSPVVQAMLPWRMPRRA